MEVEMALIWTCHCAEGCCLTRAETQKQGRPCLGLTTGVASCTSTSTASTLRQATIIGCLDCENVRVLFLLRTCVQQALDGFTAVVVARFCCARLKIARDHEQEFEVAYTETSRIDSHQAYRSTAMAWISVRYWHGRPCYWSLLRVVASLYTTARDPFWVAKCTSTPSFSGGTVNADLLILRRDLNV